MMQVFSKIRPNILLMRLKQYHEEKILMMVKLKINCVKKMKLAIKKKHESTLLNLKQ